MKKKEEATEHRHTNFTFRWRTDFFQWACHHDPDMTNAEKMIGAIIDNCEECIFTYAQKTTEDPIAVLNILGVAYTWAQKNARGIPLYGEEGVFLSASEAILKKIHNGSPAWAIKALQSDETPPSVLELSNKNTPEWMTKNTGPEKAPRTVLQEILEDCVGAIRIPKAEWAPPLEDTRPPWVSETETHPRYHAPTPPTPLTHRLRRHLHGLWTTTTARLRALKPTPPPKTPEDTPETVEARSETAPPTGPPRLTSTPTPPDHEDHVGTTTPTGLVHQTPQWDTLRAAVPAPPEGTRKAELIALLWETRGDTSRVQEHWKATHGTKAPSDLYRYARTWARDLATTLITTVPAHAVHDTLTGLDVHLTPAMRQEVDAVVASHTTVRHLRSTG
uniref:PNPL.22 n=1 Tax=Nocardiopsis sp. 25L-1-1c TaxID=1009683 RepID=R4HDF7_9ACTN|nr:pNPL.22 [Nocardiopsis sp. 25L-1-1c]